MLRPTAYAQSRRRDAVAQLGCCTVCATQQWHAPDSDSTVYRSEGRLVGAVVAGDACRYVFKQLREMGVRKMGEYFRAVNLTKKQYLDPAQLGLSEKLSGILEPPFASLIVWLLAEGGIYPGKGPWEGAWARDQIVLAGDMGTAADGYQSLWHDGEYQNVTIPVFEEFAFVEMFRRCYYWEQGFITDDGHFVTDSEKRNRFAKDRLNCPPPDKWYEPKPFPEKT